MNNNYLSNSIMNMNLDEEIRKTNEDFINILRQLPNSRLKKKLQKQRTKERKIGEKKALQSVKNIFDENKQLKAELREKKQREKKQKHELSDLRRQKKELSRKLNEEIKTAKYVRSETKKELKEQVKQFRTKIKQHPVYIKNRDKAIAYKMFKLLSFEIKQLETAYNGTVGKYACRKKVKKNHDFSIKCENGLQIEVILNKTIEARRKFYTDLLTKERGLKIREQIQCVFKKYNQELDDFEYMTVHLGSAKTSYTFINSSDIDDKLKRASETFGNLVDEFNEYGSGSVIDAFVQVIIHKASYSPLSGRSYIKLPPYLENKKALINIKNYDDECFRYCICAHKYPKSHNAERLSSYTEEEKKMCCNLEGIELPVKSCSNVYRKIEAKNDFSFNVYATEPVKDRYKIYPIYNSDEKKPIHVNLLLYYEETDEGFKKHYVYIKNFNKLLNDKTKNDHKKYFCYRCLHNFTTQELLDKHNHDHPKCVTEPTSVVYPSKEEAFIQFNKIYNKFRAPFAIYADFESCLEHMDQDDTETNTKKIQLQTANSCCYYIVSNFDYEHKPLLIRNDIPVQTFIENIIEDSNKISEYLHQNKDMIFTEEDEKRHKSCKSCHICDKPLNGDKVKDHCHITGKYIGPAHHDCNINRNYKNYKVPVFIHNCKGYDSHLIINKLVHFDSIKKLKVIPKTEEKYITFEFGKLKFVDSLSFMNKSLDKLVENLRNGDKYDMSNFKHTLKYFKSKYPNLTDEQLKLVVKKGEFPYEYMTDKSKFNDTTLPAKEWFNSKLTPLDLTKKKDVELLEKKYNNALKAWNTFNIKTLGEYNDFYLTLDVLLLADVFENFRTICLSNYGLDPAYYLTAPSLSMDALLKGYGKQIEVFNADQSDMYLFVEKMIRGGISMICHRHAKANNKYLDVHNKEELQKYILYLDANNLYGYAMSQYLPVGGYKWNTELWDENKIMRLKDEDDIGYIFQVDLIYPTELHDKHKYYPLCPTRRLVTDNMLSDFTTKLKIEKNITSDHVEKLICDLGDKKNYIMHYRNLKQALQLGLRLDGVHKVLQFRQEPWMKNYIDGNTARRAKSKNDFEKEFYKLMNNAVYGKQLENTRKHANIELILNDEAKLKRYINRPTFKSQSIFHENLVAVHMHKKEIKLNKPIIGGACILDLSKHLMYDFFYNVLQNKYGADNIKLLFTDTDSLFLEITTNDLYKDIYDDREFKKHFDFSDYPTYLYEEIQPEEYVFNSDEYVENREPTLYYNQFLHSNENKKVIGKFKDESFVPIVEYVGMASKMYSFKTVTETEKKTAKGVSSWEIKKNIKFSDYKNCLENRQNLFHKMRTIKSIKHQLYTVEQTKKSLTVYDNKRYILNDGITSLPYNHYLIK